VSDAEGTLSQVRVAQEALDEATQRQRVAVEAVIDFALRAVLDGHDLEPIMEVCGFREGDQVAATGIAGLLGFQGTARQRFASWMGSALAERIMRAGGGQ